MHFPRRSRDRHRQPSRRLRRVSVRLRRPGNISPLGWELCMWSAWKRVFCIFILCACMHERRGWHHFNKEAGRRCRLVVHSDGCGVAGSGAPCGDLEGTMQTWFGTRCGSADQWRGDEPVQASSRQKGTSLYLGLPE
eukprot:4858866-Prymnesium_polylepis.1